MSLLIKVPFAISNMHRCVSRYQKQLQLNYVQMYRRNKTLEGELDEINRTVEKQVCIF